MQRFDLYPAKLMGDSAYGSAEMLGWLVYEHGIEPHATVFNKSLAFTASCARASSSGDWRQLQMLIGTYKWPRPHGLCDQASGDRGGKSFPAERNTRVGRGVEMLKDV